MNIQKMLKQAQQMQTRMQQEMEAVSPGDLEMLQDLVVAALNEAGRPVFSKLPPSTGEPSDLPRGLV